MVFQQQRQQKRSSSSSLIATTTTTTTTTRLLQTGIIIILSILIVSSYSINHNVILQRQISSSSLLLFVFVSSHRYVNSFLSLRYNNGFNHRFIARGEIKQQQQHQSQQKLYFYHRDRSQYLQLEQSLFFCVVSFKSAAAACTAISIYSCWKSAACSCFCVNMFCCRCLSRACSLIRALRFFALCYFCNGLSPSSSSPFHHHDDDYDRDG
jgi:hypothetical protein